MTIHDFPKVYLRNPQPQTVRWHHIGKVALSTEMIHLTNAGAIIAGGAALGMLTDTPYGDVDYYVGANKYNEVAETLSHTRTVVAPCDERASSYLMVYTWSEDVDDYTKYKADFMDFSQRKHKPITEMPTKVEHPELYRLASGLNPAPPLKFQSKTDPADYVAELPKRVYENSIDVIPTPDDDPRDFVAREFDLSVCKVYVGRGGMVYAMYPDDIRAKRVSQIFDRRMTYNKSKLGTLEGRLKKYIDRGYEYYEYSRLYKLNLPSPLTLGHGISNDEELGRLVERVCASIDLKKQMGSPFLHPFRRATAIRVSADCTNEMSPAYLEFSRLEIEHGEIPNCIGLAPTPDDIELAHALFRFYPPIKYGVNCSARLPVTQSGFEQLLTHNLMAKPTQTYVRSYQCIDYDRRDGLGSITCRGIHGIEAARARELLLVDVMRKKNGPVTRDEYLRATREVEKEYGEVPETDGHWDTKADE